MTKKELDIWFKYQKALDNNNYFEKEDKRELVRLNFLVMEIAHKIHNNNMLRSLAFDSSSFVVKAQEEGMKD